MPNDPRDNQAAGTNEDANADANADVAPRRGAAVENAREDRWEQPWMAAAVEAMRVVPNLTEAARSAGVARTTVQRAVQRNERFAVAMSDAREQALDTIESSLLLRARSGQAMRKRVTKTLADGRTEVTEHEEVYLSDSAAFFLLKRYRPEFRDTYRVEQSGPGGGPIQVEQKVMDAAVGFFDAEVVRLAAGLGEGSDPLGDGGASEPIDP